MGAPLKMFGKVLKMFKPRRMLHEELDGAHRSLAEEANNETGECPVSPNPENMDFKGHNGEIFGCGFTLEEAQEYLDTGSATVSEINAATKMINIHNRYAGVEQFYKEMKMLLEQEIKSNSRVEGLKSLYYLYGELLDDKSQRLLN